MNRGWLTGQLPRAMASDPVVAGIAALCEEIAGTLRADADQIEHLLDAATSPPQMLRYLASWVDADVDPTVGVHRQREVLLVAGQLLSRRGTRHGLELLLEAVTGERVRVTDGGGVVVEGAAFPPPDPRVFVEIDGLDDGEAADDDAAVGGDTADDMTGGDTEQGPARLEPDQIRAIIAAEVPVGAIVVIRPGQGRRQS